MVAGHLVWLVIIYMYWLSLLSYCVVQFNFWELWKCTFNLPHQGSEKKLILTYSFRIMNTCGKCICNIYDILNKPWNSGMQSKIHIDMNVFAHMNMYTDLSLHMYLRIQLWFYKWGICGRVDLLLVYVLLTSMYRLQD